MGSLERKRKRVGRKSLWQRVTRRFRLRIVNEDELRDVVSRSVSWLDLIVLFLALAAVISVIAIMLYRCSPSQKRLADNDYMLRQQVVSDMLRLDSIENIVSTRDYYIQNIQNILLGKIDVDSVTSIDSIVTTDPNLEIDRSDIEKAFVEQYEEAERYNVTSQTPVAGDVQSRNLFRPASGVITVPFDMQKRHYGVDIAASPNESVVSILDGTVVMSGYTSEDGYVICIHHAGDMISVYKYCSSLLKKEGDKVKAGDVVALVGNVGSVYSSSHLHFELWYEGQPLDPQNYIVF